MFENLSLEYPSWYIVLCLMLGLLFAGVVYFKSKKIEGAPSWLSLLLSFLRFLAVSIIAFFLLTPLLKSLKEEIKSPIIIIAQDESNSTENKALNEGISSLSTSLSEIFEVQNLYFATDIQSTPLDSLQKQSTNLSKAVEYIYENYGDQNIGSIIIASDGIYNEGKNPAYANVKFSAPINSILLGDTTRQKDIAIKSLYYNKIVYLGDEFQVQADISAFNGAGEAIKVSIQKKGSNGYKTLQEKLLTIEGNNFFNTIDFTIPADESGVVSYRVISSSLRNESTTSNNKKDFYIDVLDARKKVLIVANGPHPDLAAIKQSILLHKNYQCEIKYADDTNLNLKDYNTVILHNLPSQKYAIQGVLDILLKNKISTLFVAGSQINVGLFNEKQKVVNIKSTGKNTEDVLPILNENFNNYTISESLSSKLKRMPPMVSLFGEYVAEPNSNVLLYQSIKKIPTKYPLLAFNDKDGHKQGVLLGEGFWKWKMEDFISNQNYEATSELLNKSIQYLSVKDDKRKFKCFASKNIYKENENIDFTAQFYNDAYELINTPDVYLKIKNSDGEVYDYTMSKVNNYYSINAGRFSEGSYTYSATTTFAGNKFDAFGKFSIESVQLENNDMVARHDVMNALSEKFGGKSYDLSEVSKLANDIKQSDKVKPVIYQSSSTSALINEKWIFFLLFLLLALEWFLRRFYGKY